MIRKTCDRCGTGENVNWVVHSPRVPSVVLDACDSCWEEYSNLFDRWLERKMDDAKS